METPDDLGRGWCIGHKPQGPHFVEALHEATTRMRLCSRCWGRWVRDDIPSADGSDEGVNRG